MYHLKLVGRQIFQRKGYFVINTIGLAVALTASVLIYTFLVKEWQTNTYHKNVDHIYRITVQTDGYAYWGSEVCSSLGEIAKAELPEVTDYTRIITAREMKIRWENDDHYQTGISCGYADRQLFSMFTFPLVTGSIQALEQRGCVVISESIARRYFKDENPIGKPVHTWKCFDIPDYRGHERYATPFIHSSRRDSGFFRDRTFVSVQHGKRCTDVYSINRRGEYPKG